MRPMFLLWVSLVLVLLTGCASWRTITVTDPRNGVEYTVDRQFNYLPGIEGLAKACAEEAGQTITQVVEVEGFYDDSEDHCGGACISRLLESDFQYLELNVKESLFYRALPEKGVWKVYKADKSDPHCNAVLSKEIKQRVGKLEQDFIVHSCLASVKQDHIESRYGVYFEESEKYLLDDQWVRRDRIDRAKVSVDRIAKLITMHETVKDQKLKIAIGETISPMLFPHPFRVPHNIGCNALKINGFENWTRHLTFLPLNTH